MKYDGLGMQLALLSEGVMARSIREMCDKSALVDLNTQCDLCCFRLISGKKKWRVTRSGEKRIHGNFLRNSMVDAE